MAPRRRRRRQTEAPAREVGEGRQVLRQVAAGEVRKEEAQVTGRPIFRQFNLVVHDMDATVAFYRRLGVAIPDTGPDWDGHHRSAVMPDGVDLDLDSVAFARQWDEG